MDTDSSTYQTYGSLKLLSTHWNFVCQIFGGVRCVIVIPSTYYDPLLVQECQLESTPSKLHFAIYNFSTCKTITLVKLLGLLYVAEHGHSFGYISKPWSST